MADNTRLSTVKSRDTTSKSRSLEILTVSLCVADAGTAFDVDIHALYVYATATQTCIITASNIRLL